MSSTDNSPLFAEISSCVDFGLIRMSGHGSHTLCPAFFGELFGVQVCINGTNSSGLKARKAGVRTIHCVSARHACEHCSGVNCLGKGPSMTARPPDCTRPCSVRIVHPPGGVPAVGKFKPESNHKPKKFASLRVHEVNRKEGALPHLVSGDQRSPGVVMSWGHPRCSITY